MTRQQLEGRGFRRGLRAGLSLVYVPRMRLESFLRHYHPGLWRGPDRPEGELVPLRGLERARIARLVRP